MPSVCPPSEGLFGSFSVNLLKILRLSVLLETGFDHTWYSHFWILVKAGSREIRQSENISRTWRLGEIGQVMGHQVGSMHVSA